MYAYVMCTKMMIRKGGFKKETSEFFLKYADSKKCDNNLKGRSGKG